MFVNNVKYSILVNDDGKLLQRYINKKYNALKENLICELTYQQYCYLVYNAGLKSSDLGFTGKKYVLARYNDEGPYTLSSCRFITQKENVAERVQKHNSSKCYTCCDCGKKLRSHHMRCKVCDIKYRKIVSIEKRTSSGITRDELKKMLRQSSFLQIGKKYNVSDNAVRKWCKLYGLPTHSLEIRKMSEEQWRAI